MLTAHGVTDAGRVRKGNEDSLISDSEMGLFVVADGMGGHNAGEIASRLAVESIVGFLTLSRDGEDFTWPYGLNPSLSLTANRLMTSIKLANRRVFKADHRSNVPNFGCYIKADVNGKLKYFAVTRQMVLFAVERRKAWRMLQSKAGVVNKDYLAQKALLAKLDKGELQLAEVQSRTRELFETELAAMK